MVHLFYEESIQLKRDMALLFISPKILQFVAKYLCPSDTLQTINERIRTQNAGTRVGHGGYRDSGTTLSGRRIRNYRISSLKIPSILVFKLKWKTKKQIPTQLFKNTK